MGVQLRRIGLLEQEGGGVGYTHETSITTTSGTEHDFTGLPSGLNEIIIPFKAVSLDARNDIIVQIGDAGGFETTGYISGSVGFNDGGGSEVAAATVGFTIQLNTASSNTARAFSGSAILTRYSGNIWSMYAVGRLDGTIISHSGGRKELSGALTQVRITSDGTANFDAGEVGLMHQ